jgi:hypothetical protein
LTWPGLLKSSISSLRMMPSVVMIWLPLLKYQYEVQRFR